MTTSAACSRSRRIRGSPTRIPDLLPQGAADRGIAVRGSARFEKNENLFLDERLECGYIPGVVARGPFLIGFQERTSTATCEGAGHPRRLDDPRISATEGEPVFLPLGGQAPYLQHVASVLDAIHQGLSKSKEMFAEFAALDLVAPVELEVRLTADEHHRLHGYYTINDERLRELDDVSSRGSTRPSSSKAPIS